MDKTIPQASLFGTNSNLIKQLKILDKPNPGMHMANQSNEDSSVEENTPGSDYNIKPGKGL